MFFFPFRGSNYEKWEVDGGAANYLRKSVIKSASSMFTRLRYNHISFSRSEDIVVDRHLRAASVTHVGYVVKALCLSACVVCVGNDKFAWV